MKNKELIKDAIKALELALNHLEEINIFDVSVFCAKNDIKDTMKSLEGVLK